MGAVLEISYFNSIVIAGGRDGTSDKPGVYHIEESRIKGEYNGTQMDYGARAHITNEEYGERTRENALIHSGIFNSRTNVNELNQFPIGEEITRAVDANNGGVQKLHAEDTNLNIFQENKVNAALIDKDAIFTAEGQALTASGKIVIGQVTPYAGNYGISKNPESFAVYGGRKYFADKNRGAVLRLSRDGLTPISEAGMKDFFKDNLVLCDNIYGCFDEQKQKYVVSLQGSTIDGGKISTTSGGSPVISTAVSGYRTLCYSERVGGWVSFYSYKPIFGASLNNEFYTFNGKDMYKHYDTTVPRGKFYEADFPDPAYVDFIFNDQPSIIKSFLTINYEGTTGWAMDSLSSGGYAITGYNAYDNVNEAYKIPKEGTVVSGETIGFVRKEGKYFSEIRNKATDFFQDNTYFNTTGIKGYYTDVRMQYWNPTEDATATKAELFGASSEVTLSSK